MLVLPAALVQPDIRGFHEPQLGLGLASGGGETLGGGDDRLGVDAVANRRREARLGGLAVLAFRIDPVKPLEQLTHSPRSGRLWRRFVGLGG